MTTANPFILIVIDGFGWSENTVGNAVALARKPTLDRLQREFPFTLLQASGQAVGLDWGEPGNSEVGHLSLGAGRIVKHYFSIINQAITNGSFFHNKVLLEAIQRVQASGGKLHLLGLLTAGSVHASFKHLLALLEMAKKHHLPQIYLHLFTDGKDSGLKEGTALLKRLDPFLEEMPNLKIATLIGRNYAIERNNDWQKTQTAYYLWTEGEGQAEVNLGEALKKYYQQGLVDYEIPPTVFAGLSRPLMANGDSVVLFNFREDGMRQAALALAEDDFNFFPRSRHLRLDIVSLTHYFSHPKIAAAFPLLEVKNHLAVWLSGLGKKQFHIAESEKYAHVTLFFNGLSDKVCEGETDFFLKSPRDLANFPEMRSQEIAQKVVSELRRNYYDFFLINFANADFLSHLGNINLVAKGIEKVDAAISLIYEEVKKQKGRIIITSDHGNAESLTYSATGERETRHNLSPVPCYLAAEELAGKSFSFGETTGILPDIAPTILELMNLPLPPEMNGQSLLKKLS